MLKQNIGDQAAEQAARSDVDGPGHDYYQREVQWQYGVRADGNEHWFPSRTDAKIRLAAITHADATLAVTDTAVLIRRYVAYGPAENITA